MDEHLLGKNSPECSDEDPLEKSSQGQKNAPTKQWSRRSFIKTGVGTAALAATGVGLSGCSDKSTDGRRMAMVIDLTRCSGCTACSIACKAEFNVRLGVFRSWVNSAESGTYPRVKRFFLPRLCNQCKSSTCSLVCPTGATYEREDGIVMVDKDKCIGCRYCMNACPYGARYFNWQRDGSKDVARTFGVVDKCDFCAHRVDQGQVPSCVQTCPGSARIFGDLNDPESEVAILVATKPTHVLMPGKGTDPQVYYIGLDDTVVKGILKGGR